MAEIRIFDEIGFNLLQAFLAVPKSVPAVPFDQHRDLGPGIVLRYPSFARACADVNSGHTHGDQQKRAEQAHHDRDERKQVEMVLFRCLGISDGHWRLFIMTWRVLPWGLHSPGDELLLDTDLALC